MILHESDYQELNKNFDVNYPVRIDLTFKNGRKTAYYARNADEGLKLISSLQHLLTTSILCKQANSYSAN